MDDIYGSDEDYYNGEYEDDYDRDPEPESDDDLSCGKAPSCRVWYVFPFDQNQVLGFYSVCFNLFVLLFLF